jgi:hypothetical protein
MQIAKTIRSLHAYLAIALGFFFLFVGSISRADDTHYQDYPLGSRAVGLGGAFGAIGSDASGIFYNPAGLVDASRNSVSISSNLYGVEISIEENLFSAVGQSLSDIEAVVADINIIPNSAGYVGTFDKRDGRGRHVHSYGWGIFVPSYRSINIQTSDRKQGLSYRRDLLDRELHTAVSYAYRFDEDWSFGVSAVFNFRQLKDFEENTKVEQEGDFDQFNTAQTSLRAFVGTTLLSLGLKVEFWPNWFLGATMTTPGIEVYDYAELRIMKTKTISGMGVGDEDSTFSLIEPVDIRASFKNGGQLRIGFARIFPRKLTFAADLVLHAPVFYKLIELPPQQAALLPEITIETGIHRNLVGNVSVGAEWLVADKVSLASGVFTNFSSSDRIPDGVKGVLKQDYLPHVNEYGVSGVLGYFTEHTLTRLGTMMTYGQGADVIPQQSAEGQYRKIKLQSIYLYVFFSSTFRY